MNTALAISDECYSRSSAAYSDEGLIFIFVCVVARKPYSKMHGMKDNNSRCSFIPVVPFASYEVSNEYYYYYYCFSLLPSAKMPLPTQ